MQKNWLSNVQFFTNVQKTCFLIEFYAQILEKIKYFESEIYEAWSTERCNHYAFSKQIFFVIKEFWFFAILDRFGQCGQIFFP